MTDDDLTQPPHDLHAEMAAVGSAIQTPEALASVVDTCAPERFYRPAHEAILNAALALYGSGQPIDPVTVAAELDRRGELVKFGGAPYLHTLMQAVPTTANAGFYAEIVASKAVLRSLVDAATGINQLAREPHDRDSDPAATVERARALLDLIARDARTDSEQWSAGQLTDAAMERYQASTPDGILTGWKDVDQLLVSGLRPGSLIVVGARPKVGKSSVGVAMLVQVASRGTPVGMVSLEMPQAELFDKVIAQLSSVNLADLQRCNLSQGNWQRVSEASRKARSLPMTIWDSPRQTLTSIQSHVRDLRRPNGPGCELLVVDYLGLVTPAERRGNRQEEVAAISRGLKLMAKDLRIPIVALAQINRGPEARTDRRPMPSDLRESGAIEADADQVWLLHREPENEGEIELNIAYNRHGPAATVHLAWTPEFARVKNLIKIHEEAA